MMRGMTRTSRISRFLTGVASLGVALVLTATTPHFAHAQDGPRPAPPPGAASEPAYPPAPVQSRAPALEQVRAGDALMVSGRYREAAAQYEAAYAIDPALVILERLADAYRLAGDTQRASLLYQRIAAQRNAERGYPTGMALGAPLVLPAPKRPGTTLLNAGIGLFAGGYGVALTGGVIGLAATSSLGSSSSRDQWYGATGLLLLPIVGPFATAAYQNDPIWVVPWAVISGGMQLAGLSLMIVGGIQRSKHKAPPPVTVAPFVGGGANGLAAIGRF
jgi:hypothetical protein